MTSMSPDDLLARESIRHTMASYTIAGDRLRVDDFIAVFTEDAVLESEGVPQEDVFHYHGRQAIREWIERWTRVPDARTASPPRASFVRHHLSTCLIDLTGPDTAKARTYWVAYTDIGPDHCGHYLDSFRKVGDRWLIVHRRVRLDWRSPESLFRSAITDTSRTY
jgi:ketosteroid isomerase-like protein